MPLEAVTYVGDLVVTNPAGSDQKAQGDDHIRNIKTALRNTFPSASGPVPLGGWNGKTDAVNSQGGSYTIQLTDDGKLLYFSLAASHTLTLIAAATAGAGFVAWVQKDDTLNTLTIDGNLAETINAQATIILGPNEGGLLYCDGTKWIWIGPYNQWTGERLIRRQENDALSYPGVRLQRVRTGASVDADLGVRITAEHKDSAGNVDEVGAILWKALNRLNGSEAMEWVFQTALAGAVAARFRLGAGLYAEGTTDKGVGTGNFLTGAFVGGKQVPVASYAVKAVTYAIDAAADVGAIIRWTTAGTSATLPAVASTPVGFFVTLVNDAATGDVTIDGNLAETIDGLATRLLRPGDRATVYCDGTAWRTIRGRYSFTSTEIALNNGSAAVQAHGLGIIPRSWRLVLRCKTAELGYAIGDEIPLGGDYGDQAATASGVQIVVNATNVYLLQATIQVKALNRTTPATAVVLTTANWMFEVRAYDEYV